MATVELTLPMFPKARSGISVKFCMAPDAIVSTPLKPSNACRPTTVSAGVAPNVTVDVFPTFWKAKYAISTSAVQSPAVMVRAPVMPPAP